MTDPHGQPGHPSILDVARRAGVSPATVSRALRGLPNVSASTRERVLAAAADLAYVASPAASGLASGRSNAVAVVVPFVTRWYFSQVVTGVESVLRQAGHDLLLYNLGDAEGTERFFTGMPLARRVDAVIVVGLPLDTAQSTRLRDLRVPVVLVGYQTPGFGSVRIDDDAGTSTAVHHLLNLGHEEVAMIGGYTDEGVPSLTPAIRRAAFERTLAEAGRSARAEHVVAAPWGIEGGARAMEQLLSGARMPTAVFAESDEMAFGAMRTLRRARLRVPRNLSLVGFDDHELADVVDLTTVAQPVHDLGGTAAQMVLAMLADPAEPPGDVVLPTRLVVRGSTAPPAAEPAMGVAP